MNAPEVSATTPATAPAAANPYPGLRPFLPDEEHLFFGRDRQVDGMVTKLAATRFLAIVGSSGSGKSSLVNCGLRPALHRGLMAQAGTRWRVAQFRPGNRPIHALAQSLARLTNTDAGDAGPFSPADFVETTLRSSKLGLLDAFEECGFAPGTNLLVVADQFEELFRYRHVTRPAGEGGAHAAQDAGEDATAFVNLLVEAGAQKALPVYVVLTMRSDFLGDCAQFSGLPEAINAGQYLVPRLTREERRLAITGPAGLSGAQISPVLLTRLVNDVGDNPDQLSILQHALNRTWARWQAQGDSAAAIDLPHYEGIGAMAHALDAHAEEAWAELDDTQKALCARIFKALTDRSTDARGTRRPTRMQDLCAIVGANTDAVAAVIEVFRQPGRAFLMPPAGDTLDAQTVVDISHESLMRVWERLVRWADEENDSAQIYRRLAANARLYPRQAPLLWDPALQVTLDWKAREQPNEAWALRYDPGFAAAMDYLDLSLAERERYQGELRRRRNRKRLGILGAAALGLMALGALGWVGAEQRKSDELKSAVQLLQSSQLVAQAQAAHGAGRLDQALLLSTAAMQLKPHQEAQDAFLDILRDAPRRLLHGHGDSKVANLTFSADGRTLATAGQDGKLLLWNAADGTLRASLTDGPRGGVFGLAFARDGTRLVAAGQTLDSSTAWALAADHASATALAAPAKPPQQSSTGAVHADRGLVAAADVDSRITVWDIRRGQVLAEAAEHRALITALAFNPDGRLLASADDAGRLQLRTLDASGPGATRLLAAPGSLAITGAAFSPDGRWLASVRVDRGVDLWNVDTGARAQSFLGQGDEEFSQSSVFVAFSPDARYVAWSGSHGTVHIGEVGTDNRAIVRRKVGGNLERLAFRGDSRMLAVTDRDGTVLLWDLERQLQLEPELHGHARPVSALAFSADGRTLATAAVEGDPVVVLWDVAPERVRAGRVASSLEAVRGLAFSPDGRWLAIAGEDATVSLRPVGGRGAARELLADGLTALQSVAFSTDGRWLGVGSTTGQVVLWDLAAADAYGRLLDAHAEGVTSIAFGGGAAPLLASASIDETVQVFDAATGRRRHRLPLGTLAQSVAFAPDGQWLAAGGTDGKVVLWNLGAAGDDPPARLEFGAHKEGVVGLAFTPDGKRLVSGSLDRTVRQWNLATREAIGPALEHKARVLDIALAADGKTVAAAGADGRITLWDLSRGARVALPLNGHEDDVLGVAFSPDGRWLASAGSDRQVLLWDVGVASWHARACAIANRDAVGDSSGSAAIGADDGTSRRGATRGDWPRALSEQMAGTKVCPAFVAAPARPMSRL